MKKIPKSYRLTPSAVALVLLLAQKLGLTLTGVIETAIRRLAKEELGDQE